MYNLTTNKEGYCLLWHEGISGRSGNDIASTLVKTLEVILKDKPQTNKIILWSDACVPQNRNAHMSVALIKFLERDNHNVRIIEHKYQEPGHSAVQEVDSMHATIERHIKNTELHSPLAVFRAIANCRSNKKFKVRQMVPAKDFFDFKPVALKSNLNKVPYSKIKHIQYEKGNNTVKYKCSFSDSELSRLVSWFPPKQPKAIDLERQKID